jgi:tRNA-2-methylthio-N6-dimethylallyladenosine synthase
MPKFFIKTYGCQMNERDSEQVAHSLITRGYERVESEREADVILLNTCSVRDMADQKALGKMGMLGRIAKERPHVVFGFLGCMAQARGPSLLNNLPHVDLVVGTQKFHRVADYVEELVVRKREVLAGVADPGHRRMDDVRFSIVDIAEERGSQSTIRDQQLVPRQATAFVSIMQGCNMHCTFCIVPQTRGAERSRSIDEIVREVRGLVARGAKEVTLLGQIVNLYGRHEFPKVDSKSPFVQLLEAVHDIDGLERLRFTSPHPIGFRDDLIDAFGRLPKLTEHVHPPLQSGSNKILKAMHRTHGGESGSCPSHPAGATASRLRRTSLLVFLGKLRTITSGHGTWSNKSSSITHSFFAIRREATRLLPKCRSKLRSGSKKSAIRICLES